MKKQKASSVRQQGGKALFANIYNRITGKCLRSEKPERSKAWFWEHQLGEDVTGGFYRNWKYPDKLLTELFRLRDYCKEHSIKLIILAPPTHIDLQKKVAEYSLSDEYNRYKEDMLSLGIFMDYDITSGITKDRDNYGDPYHFNAKIAKYLVSEISKELKKI